MKREILMSEGLTEVRSEKGSAGSKMGVSAETPLALATKGNQRGDSGAVLVTQVGLQMDPGLTMERWMNAGRRIAEVASSSSWCLGDWINYGETRYADRYRECINAVGLDYQTIRNYAWVARKIEIHRRRANLSFQHHAEVASMPHERQDYWLGRAEAEGWSRTRLRQSIREARNGEQEASQKVVLPRLAADHIRLERWRQAAEHSSVTLQEWIVGSLDRQAEMAFDREQALEEH
ncbi:LmbU family transcriptional regulator [Paractinoplanes maris]|uniref:LmbU family transcriptional regulator n=1 Tax=Paractinoplanes maris TaxID=1734446 RepID=UPI00202231DF|nr:LmbU family transcriptional regulator [Actinoplanes maris]